VLAVSGVPHESHHFYFGAVNGGVWETRDAGRTWQPVFDSVPVGSIGALAVAASNGNVIYVGTGEADMRSDIAQGHGVFKSIDAGHTWQSLGLEDSQQIGRILVDPHNPDVVLVAALGHPYGPNETRGVYRSADGGKTWQRTLYRDADTGAIELAAVPAQPNVVYAALWQTRRPPWNVYPPSNGPGSGLYKSTDEGQTWTPVTGHGLPAKPGRIGLAVSPSSPQRVFALIDAEDGGLYRSDDAASSWTRVSEDSRIWKRGWYFGGITVDPSNDNVVYVCNTAMYASDDGGKRFLPVKGAPGGDDYHQLWIDPDDPRRRILGVDQGALVTLDGGASWSSWYNQPTGQFYHVVTDNRFPYWVYGAQQDSGAAGVPSRTDHIDGINLTQFREVTAGGESDNIAPDPDDPSIVFGGRVDKLDQRTGQTQRVDPTLAYPDLYRGTWTLPLQFGTAGTHALYFANQRIFRTADRGKHWDVISPDLSRETSGVPGNLDAATIADDAHAGPRRGVVYSIGPSPLDEKVIWAGTDDGLVWVTRDRGAHWRNVTPTALSAWSKIGVIEPSHFDVESAYIAVDRHRLDDPDPYIYRTHDGGASWTLIKTGIGEPGAINAVNVVREDPRRRGLLYSGTEHGVYVSFDDGGRWQTIQQGLPRTSVRDLQVHGNDLVIATHGRGFWIMDDIAPLRSVAEEARSGVRLFPLAPAYRVHPTGFTGTPMPKDEPMAPNPPPGAYIDYALDSTTDPVSLSIYDANGTLVRTFDSREKQTQPDLAKIDIAPEWVAEPAPPATGPGMHRFIWNLHYAPPAALKSEDPTEPEDGVWVPPGQYSVVLRVAGQRYQQDLTVTPDPRVRLASAAYARQFALARHIEEARLRIAAALAAATKLHAALEGSRKNAAPGNAVEFSDADQRLLAITDIAGEKPSPDAMDSPPKTVRGLRYLGSQFQHLARAVDTADGSPSADVVRGYNLDVALLDAVLTKWERFKAIDLPKLNELQD
jgi:photosystem II stability/assembly factor-like uncharacterized protein